MPGGGGLGERFRGDVRQGQHKRRRGVQGASEPGEDEIRPGPIAAAQLGPATVVAIRRRVVGTGRVDGAHTGATGAPPEKSRRRRRQRRLRRRRRRQIETQLVFDIVKDSTKNSNQNN